MRPTLEELQTFWLLAYSRSSLLDARAFLKAMDTARPGSLELRAMLDAAVVAYARPFTKFQLTRARVGRLPFSRRPFLMLAANETTISKMLSIKCSLDGQRAA